MRHLQKMFHSISVPKIRGNSKNTCHIPECDATGYSYEHPKCISDRAKAHEYNHGSGTTHLPSLYRNTSQNHDNPLIQQAPWEIRPVEGSTAATVRPKAIRCGKVMQNTYRGKVTSRLLTIAVFRVGRLRETVTSIKRRPSFLQYFFHNRALTLIVIVFRACRCQLAFLQWRRWDREYLVQNVTTIIRYSANGEWGQTTKYVAQFDSIPFGSQWRHTTLFVFVMLAKYWFQVKFEVRPRVQ